MTESLDLGSVLEKKDRIEDVFSLVAELYDLIDGEIEKKDADDDLIFEAADMLAYLGGDTEGESEAGVDRIRETVKKRVCTQRADKASSVRGVRRKAVIPIAAVLVIIASLAVAAVALGGRFTEWTNERWRSVEPGVKVAEADYEVEKSKDDRSYDGFEAMLEAEGITGLLIPDGITVSDPLVVEYGDYRKITATLTDADGNILEYYAEYPSQAEKINAELTKIGAFDVSLTSYEGSYQAEFISNGVWYLIKTGDRDALTAFIGSLGK